MALKKQITTRFGNQAEYWRIVSLGIDYDKKEAGFTIAGYYNKDARLENRPPVEKRSYKLIIYDYSDNDLRKTIYKYLKDPKPLLENKDIVNPPIPIMFTPLDQTFNQAEDI